jgi:hypothetical protein
MPPQRTVRLLSMRRTLACWSRGLTEPVRASRVSALCAWVNAPLQPPRLRRGPLLGRCLDEVLDGERIVFSDPEPLPPATIPARAPARTRRSPRPVAPDPVAAAAAACGPEPARRPRPARAHPMPSPSRAGRPLLRRLAGPEPEPARPPQPATPEMPPPAVPSRPRPAPCPPDAALAPATSRTARRVDAAMGADKRRATTVPPGRQPVTGRTAPKELLYRRTTPYRTTAWERSAERSVPAFPEPVPRRLAYRHSAPAGAPADLSELEHRRGRRVRRLRPIEAPVEHRDDLPIPIPPPTASERLGPAPVVTASHPAMVEPDPVGAPTIPIAGATLRRGAARDAETPDFLDSAELTSRIAQVLEDEARRHGIEV